MSSDVIKDVRSLLESHGKPKKEVYLDSENSGLIFPEALEALIEAYKNIGYGHPSITHKIGWESYEILYESSNILANFLNCNPEEIVYTHNGTEANNLAILGLTESYKEKKKIIVSSIEHLSVIFPAEHLQKYGYKVIKIPVDKEGFVNKDFIDKNIDKDTLLVSIAAINHEIGTIHDLKAIIDIVKDKNPETFIHTDACDALGKIKIDLKKLNVDLASFSSHKVYGPKGAGALYVIEGIKLEPIIYGQLSTQKLWPSLENIPSIFGFSKAIKILYSNFEFYNSKMINLRDMLIKNIIERIEYVLLNGPKNNKRSPDNINLSFLYCEGEALTVELSLNGIYVSSGSACTSRVLEPSHVLLAIGRKYEEAHGSLLMKVTPFHNEEDIKYVIEKMPEVVSRIRSISPIKPGGEKNV